MAMKKCPICGEKYSDTYKRCPFCEEEARQEEYNTHRKGGHRAAQGGPSLLSPILIVVIVVLALLLLYLLFGDALKNRDKKPDASAASSSANVVKPHIPSSPGVSTPSASVPAVSTPGGSAAASNPAASSPAVSTPPATTPEPTVDIASLPKTLTLNKTDYTTSVGNEPVKLTVSGGSGSYTWSSSDDGIASVDENGTVVAISSGTVTVTVTDGQGKGECIVRVRAGTGVPNTGTSTPATPATTTPSNNGDNGSGGPHKLNREDFTRSTSEGSYQLQVSGVTTGVTWSSSNTAVATVDQNGNVNPVGPGKATITASWDGQSLKCIIRVPR